MNMKEFSETNWISKEEIKEVTKRGKSFVVAIATEAVLVKKNFTQPNGTVRESEKAHCLVALQDGTRKEIEFNKTSVGNIVKEFGLDSKNWIGRKVTLQVMKVPKGDAEAIYAQPVVEDEVSIKPRELIEK